MDAPTLSLLSICNQIDVKTASTAASTTNLGSSWAAGNSWGTGTAPTLSGRVPTNATTGALPLPSTAAVLGSAGYRLARYRFNMLNGAAGITCFDRLVDFGGGSAIPTTAQNTSAQVLTRYTSGIGNQIFLEVYTTGASSVATNVTVSYTNQSGTSGRTAVLALAAGWCTAQRIYMIPLQFGDTGVLSIQSFTFSAASPNAGNVGVIIAHPIGMMTSGNLNLTNGAGGCPFRDITSFCWNPILTNACLFLTYMTTTTATGACDFSYSLVLNETVCNSLASSSNAYNGNR